MDADFVILASPPSNFRRVGVPRRGSTSWLAMCCAVASGERRRKPRGLRHTILLRPQVTHIKSVQRPRQSCPQRRSWLGTCLVRLIVVSKFVEVVCLSRNSLVYTHT
ncbi:hypothetical protein CCHR01_01066 [Colletotrichum chrysophilum]|uniref:Uncharacterized protein n=1 Tax=Colletotrichum chrysophilum TaxID=1836956 RepID=A0AAD9AYE1_9PEZI|nr:hypothetical protein CCHR01_01066 [Colletotrichum chrysophilum]